MTTLDTTVRKDLVGEFSSRLEKLAGKVYRCRDRGEAISTIERLLKETKHGPCYYTKDVLEFTKTSTDTGRIEGAILYASMAGENGLDFLKEADIGITTADYGIAETGGLVEVAYFDSTKLLSSLSRIHIVLVRASKVLAKLQDVAPIIRALLTGREEKPTITFISGPSRTSDIEMKFVLGVHGPHEVHCLILEE